MQDFRENEVVEFKKSTSELKEALISISAILSKHRKGILYFGINDDGKAIGQTISNKTLRDISEIISNKIEPKIYPNVSKVLIDNKECIKVEFDGDDIPYLADGRAYIRVSDQDRKLSVSEMRKLLKLNEDDNKWDSKISNKIIDDVNEEYLKEYIERALDHNREPFKYTNKKDILTKLGLLNKNKLLNAGKVLFCENNGVDLQLAIFATETKSTFIDIKRYSGSILKLIELALNYILSNIIWNVNIIDSRYEQPEIPIESLREAIVNSFVHKLYIDPKGVEVSIFSNRVEIYNPGTFPEEFTPQDYIQNLAHSIYRNPLIAELLYKSKDVESYASGIQRIYEECTKEGVNVEFQLEAYGFTIIFYRKSAKVLKNINVSGNEGINEGINLIGEKILKFINLDKSITKEKLANKLNASLSTIERNIRKLKNDGYLERKGSNKNGYWIVKNIEEWEEKHG